MRLRLEWRCNAGRVAGLIEMMGRRASEAGAGSRDDVEARFSDLYAEHGRAVTAYLLRRVADPDDAADLVAETFLAAWRRVREVPAGPDARLWLFGIARGLHLNTRRSARRRARLIAKLGYEHSAGSPSAAEPSPETAVTAALQRLAAKDREVLTLAAWEELEPAEIASVLGISQVAARSRLHRAGARLRRELARAESTSPRQSLPAPELGEAR